MLPGIGTGPTEYLAEKVTDFTSLGTMFYRMMFNDEEKVEQNNAMNGMNEDENGQVEDQGSSFFSTAGTMLLGMVSLDDDPRALKRETWLGKNLLGEILTQIRIELMGEY